MIKLCDTHQVVYDSVKWVWCPVCEDCREIDQHERENERLRKLLATDARPIWVAPHGYVFQVDPATLPLPEAGTAELQIAHDHPPFSLQRSPVGVRYRDAEDRCR